MQHRAHPIKYFFAKLITSLTTQAHSLSYRNVARAKKIIPTIFLTLLTTLWSLILFTFGLQHQWSLSLLIVSCLLLLVLMGSIVRRPRISPQPQQTQPCIFQHYLRAVMIDCAPFPPASNDHLFINPQQQDE